MEDHVEEALSEGEAEEEEKVEEEKKDAFGLVSAMERDVGQDLECPICLEGFEAPIKIAHPCGHFYKAACLDGWVEQKKGDEDP